MLNSRSASLGALAVWRGGSAWRAPMRAAVLLVGGRRKGFIGHNGVGVSNKTCRYGRDELPAPRRPWRIVRLAKSRACNDLARANFARARDT